MPKTEHVEKRHVDTLDEAIPTDMPTRDEETEAKIKATDDLLDEIDDILETETIEHELTMADLIRRGAQLAPQTFGVLRDCDGSTCALGAAEDEAKRLGLL